MVAALLLALTGTAFAANTTELSIAQIRQNGGELYLYLTGVNENGVASLDTLSIGDYTVNMNGSPLELTNVQAFKGLGESTHYIVCVDASASIVGKECDYVRDAMTAMISGMQDNERITIFTFGDKVTQLVEMKKKDSNSLAEAVSGLTFKDMHTALYEVIDKSTQYAWAKQDQFDRTAVLIITDGADDATGGSKSYNYESIRNDVRSRNVPVYTATFFRKNAQDNASLQELAELASISGGRLSSLQDANEGWRITELLQNLEEMTRNSTKLTTQLISTMEHGNGSFTVSMDTGSGTLTSPEHGYSVSWGAVPTPTPVPVLDLLEIDDITEDSTAIRGVTEPKSHITVEYNGEPWLTFDSMGGQINYNFSGMLDSSFHLNRGDVITVSAVDEAGNDKLPNGSDARVNKTVGESKRDDITVTVDNIGENGTVYGDKLTVRGTAQENSSVLVTWVADDDPNGGTTIGPIKAKGKIYSTSLNADDCVLGTGTIVVCYADYRASSRQGNFEGVVNWQREKPVEQQEVALTVDPVSEDSETILVHTEPNAHITLLFDGKQVALGDNDHADENGRWELSLVNNTGLTLKKNKRLQVTIEDEAGRTKQTEPITVDGSSRRDIQTNVSRLNSDDRTFYGETVQIQGTAERDTTVNVQLLDTRSSALLAERTVESSGRFAVEFSAEECGIGDDGRECYTFATYADNLGDSKAYDDQSFTWFAHEPEVLPEAQVHISNRLTEDSDAIRIETEPNTEVHIVNLTRNEEVIDAGVSEPDGSYECPLGAEGKAILFAGDEIRVSIVDANGEEKTDSAVVGESRRMDISVRVKDLDANGLLNKESMVIQGSAEAGKEVEIQWQTNDEVAPEPTRTTVNPNGFYTVTLSKENFTGGTGSIKVSYADGLGQSKAKMLDEGLIEWDQVTPSPEPTPKPTPTVAPTVTVVPTETPAPTAVPTPTPTVAPTVEPTAEPTFIDKTVTKFFDFVGGRENMLKSWKFWVIVAAAVLLLALIVLGIVLLVRKHKKKAEVNSFRASEDIKREGELAEAGTERKKAPGNIGSTTRMGGNDITVESTGTVNMSMPEIGIDEPAGSGTVRLTAQNVSDSASGTVRISMDEGPQAMLLRIHEARDWQGVSQDTTLPIMEEATVGRNEDNNLVINDQTVSGHHLRLIRRDNELFALDLMSSNGTMLNGSRVTTEVKLNSGDKLAIGRTVLTIEFDS